MVIILVVTSGFCQNQTSGIQASTYDPLIEQNDERWFWPLETEKMNWYNLTTLKNQSGFKSQVSFSPHRTEERSDGWWIGKYYSYEKELALMIQTKPYRDKTIHKQGYAKWQNYKSTLYLGNLALRFANGLQLQNYSTYHPYRFTETSVQGKLHPSQNDLYGISYQVKSNNLETSIGLAEHTSKTDRRIHWWQLKFFLNDHHNLETTALMASRNRQLKKSLFHSLSITYQTKQENLFTYCIPVFTPSGSILRLGTSILAYGKLHLDWFGQIKSPKLEFAASKYQKSKYGFLANYQIQFENEYHFFFQHTANTLQQKELFTSFTCIQNEFGNQTIWKGLYAKEVNQWRVACSYRAENQINQFKHYRGIWIQQYEEFQKRSIHTILTYGIYSKIKESWNIFGWNAMVLGNRSDLVPSQIVAVPLLQSNRNPYLTETGGYLGIEITYRFLGWCITVQGFGNVVKSQQESSSIILTTMWEP
ncbi:MAG: hypothetical protein N2450_01130 [bacterium]|nr:hypothetical protein [bacterium]